jgi:antitoxin (DNA-binding transcriptional repressor) of toxin-antitoxin stability system
MRLDYKLRLNIVMSMEVKTAELKAKLSQYLRHVREEGSTYVILDRKTPVALLTPLSRKRTGEMEAEQVLDLRRTLEARGIRMRPPVAGGGQLPEPAPAPDGRTDLRSIDMVRGKRDY